MNLYKILTLNDFTKSLGVLCRTPQKIKIGKFVMSESELEAIAKDAVKLAREIAHQKAVNNKVQAHPLNDYNVDKHRNAMKTSGLIMSRCMPLGERLKNAGLSFEKFEEAYNAELKGTVMDPLPFELEGPGSEITHILVTSKNSVLGAIKSLHTGQSQRPR